MNTTATRWTRTAPGEYVAPDGTRIIRKATTFAYPRGASNPMWHVFAPGADRHTSRRATLAEAKADAARVAR